MFKPVEPQEVINIPNVGQATVHCHLTDYYFVALINGTEYFVPYTLLENIR